MIKSKVILCSLLASCAMLVSGVSAAADTPAKLAGVEIVDAAKVKSMMASGAVLIDTRVANEFADSHIKGAINVPYKEKSAKAADFDASQDSFDLSKLPSDKSTVIITQCNGPECWKSYKSAVMAVKAGYKKVFWFRNGIPEWKAKGFAVE
jgi:rhodanese-related sulfurtransferase